MNKKIRTLLLIFTSVVLIVFGTIVLEEKKVAKNEDMNISKVEKSLFIEASEVAKNDKDFYKISVKKNIKPLALHKDNTMSHYIKQIKRLLGMETADIAKLDTIMHTLLMDKKMLRIDKINAIWGILQEIGFESEQSKYLLDSLSTLLPIELTKDLIDVYTDVKDSSIKIRLIDILTENTSILNPEVQDEERLNFIVEKIQEIKLFLKENVLKEHDPQVLEEGLYAYADISDVADIQELIASFNNTENTISLPAEVFRNVLIEAAMSTPEAQENILPMLLENVKNSSTTDSKQEEHFTQMILDGITAGVITEKSQKELTTYLQKQEPTVDVEKLATTETISRYYNWAESMSKLKESGVSLKNIVLESSNPLKVSSILLYTDNHTMQQIKENPNIESVYAKLEVALEDDSIGQQTKAIIKDAFGRLKEDISINNKNTKEPT